MTGTAARPGSTPRGAQTPAAQMIASWQILHATVKNGSGENGPRPARRRTR